MSTVSTRTYTRAVTAVYVADKLRGLIRDVIRRYGLDPQPFVNSWSSSGVLARAARKWMVSEHLTAVVIEFYRPGSTVLETFWEFPIEYDGNGVDDDMWNDRAFLEGAIAKSRFPSAGCDYRVILRHAVGAPEVYGMVDTSFMSRSHLVSRQAGTVIATPDLMASAKYAGAA